MSNTIQYNYGAFETGRLTDKGIPARAYMFMNKPQDLHTILQDLYPGYIILIQSGAMYELRNESVDLWNEIFKGKPSELKVFTSGEGDFKTQRAGTSRIGFNKTKIYNFADNYIVIDQEHIQTNNLTPDGAMARVIVQKRTKGVKLERGSFPSVIDIMRYHENDGFNFGFENDVLAIDRLNPEYSGEFTEEHTIWAQSQDTSTITPTEEVDTEEEATTKSSLEQEPSDSSDPTKLEALFKQERLRVATGKKLNNNHSDEQAEDENLYSDAKPLTLETSFGTMPPIKIRELLSKRFPGHLILIQSGFMLETTDDLTPMEFKYNMKSGTGISSFNAPRNLKLELPENYTYPLTEIFALEMGYRTKLNFLTEENEENKILSTRTGFHNLSLAYNLNKLQEDGSDLLNHYIVVTQSKESGKVLRGIEVMKLDLNLTESSSPEITPETSTAQDVASGHIGISNFKVDSVSMEISGEVNSRESVGSLSANITVDNESYAYEGEEDLQYSAYKQTVWLEESGENLEDWLYAETPFGNTSEEVAQAALMEIKKELRKEAVAQAKPAFFGQSVGEMPTAYDNNICVWVAPGELYGGGELYEEVEWGVNSPNNSVEIDFTDCLEGEFYEADEALGVAKEFYETELDNINEDYPWTQAMDGQFIKAWEYSTKGYRPPAPGESIDPEPESFVQGWDFSGLKGLDSEFTPRTADKNSKIYLDFYYNGNWDDKYLDLWDNIEGIGRTAADFNNELDEFLDDILYNSESEKLQVKEMVLVEIMPHIQSFKELGNESVDTQGSTIEGDIQDPSNNETAANQPLIKSGEIPVLKEGDTFDLSPWEIARYLEAQYPRHWIMVQSGHFFEARGESVELASRILGNVEHPTYRWIKPLLNSFTNKHLYQEDTPIEKRAGTNIHAINTMIQHYIDQSDKVEVDGMIVVSQAKHDNGDNTMAPNGRVLRKVTYCDLNQDLAWAQRINLQAEESAEEQAKRNKDLALIEKNNVEDPATIAGIERKVDESAEPDDDVNINTVFSIPPQKIHLYLQNRYPDAVIFIQSGAAYEVRGEKVGLCKSEDWGSKSAKNNNEPRCGIISSITKNPQSQLVGKALQYVTKTGSIPDSFIIVSQLTNGADGSYVKMDGSVLRGVTSLCLNDNQTQESDTSLSYLLQEGSTFKDMTEMEIQETILSKLGSSLIDTCHIDDMTKGESHKTPVMTTEGLEGAKDQAGKDYQSIKSQIQDYQTQHYNQGGFYVPTKALVKEISDRIQAGQSATEVIESMAKNKLSKQLVEIGDSLSGTKAYPSEQEQKQLFDAWMDKRPNINPHLEDKFMTMHKMINIFAKMEQGDVGGILKELTSKSEGKNEI